MMWEVNLYTYTTNKSPKKRTGYISHVLETVINGNPVTKEGFEQVEATRNEAELMAALAGLRRMNTKSHITIYSESTYLLNAEGSLEHWIVNGWRNAKGEEIANKELWQELAGVMCEHELSFVQGKHSYTEWMAKECRKMESEVKG